MVGLESRFGQRSSVFTKAATIMFYVICSCDTLGSSNICTIISDNAWICIIHRLRVRGKEYIRPHKQDMLYERANINAPRSCFYALQHRASTDGAVLNLVKATPPVDIDRLRRPPGVNTMA